MRRLLLILASVAMALGTMVITPSPASAHQFDSNSFWACGATRLNGSYLVGHSWPTYIHPGGAYVRYECLDFYLDGSHETYNAALLWWNGQVSLVDTWYFCYLGEPCPDPHET